MVRPYYEHDGITIYHGDCRDILPLPCDVLVFDPPYGINWRRSVNHARNSKAHEGICNDEDTSIRDSVLHAMPNHPAVVFGSFYAAPPVHVKQVLIWHKPLDAGVVGATTGYRRDAEPIYLVGPWPRRAVSCSGVLRSSIKSISAITTHTGHPHTKPVDLIRQLIDRCPTGVILDPCMGTGSTLVAAQLQNRPAIGIEIDERYCEIAAQRLAQQVLPFECSA